MEMIIIAEVCRESRLVSVLLATTSRKGAELSIGTPIAAVYAFALVFSLGFEFPRAKDKKYRWGASNALQVVLLKLSAHRPYL